MRVHDLSRACFQRLDGAESCCRLHRTLYLDPYGRTGKFATNVMYTIRCGRQFHYPYEGVPVTLCVCSECYHSCGWGVFVRVCARAQGWVPGTNTGHVMQRERCTADVRCTMDVCCTPEATYVRMSCHRFSQASNVFHEFGHALHSLVCKSQFQHTFGTRCAIDFVEVRVLACPRLGTTSRMTVVVVLHGMCADSLHAHGGVPSRPPCG